MKGAKQADIRSSMSRGFVQEIESLVVSMHANLTADHFEFVLNKLDSVTKLRAQIFWEEENCRRAAEFVDSVREEIVVSEEYLTKNQSGLLLQAYRSLAQGNYSSAIEWAKKARDLSRELPRDEGDQVSRCILWQASLALFGIAASLVLLRSLGMSLVRPSGIANSRRVCVISKCFVVDHLVMAGLDPLSRQSM